MPSPRLRTALPLALLAGLLPMTPYASSTPAPATPPPTLQADVVILGGTSAGVIAAVQTALHGHSVLLIAPEPRLGGLSSGGLGQTDIGNKRAIGGLSRRFYERVAAHYATDSAWTWQSRAEYRDGGQTRTEPGEPAMWTFEPRVAETIFEDLVREHAIPVVRGDRLDRSRPADRSGTTLHAIHLLSGRRIEGRIFIDASYEGDLLPLAGTAWRVGREANAEFGETVNGNQPDNRDALSHNHNFDVPVDPWVTPGDPSSGLLPGIDPSGPGTPGAGDARVQAYNFRVCLTDHPDNRLPLPKPADYDASRYELLFRYYAAGYTKIPWLYGAMPNRKTDLNNNHAVSSDFIGQNHDYPEADDATRDRIIAAHRSWHQGLYWTLANDPRVPERVRNEVSRWGPPKDEFTSNRGWPDQLYVREARRLVGEVVMTEHHCRGTQVATDAVGLAAYGMDSHHVRRFVTADGRVLNEGNIQVKVPAPYPIAYGAITPRREHATNLLVPVCLSSTHIAYGSIRMEPVFMVLAQSAASAAHLALTGRSAVQDVPYDQLQKLLLEGGQVLAW